MSPRVAFLSGVAVAVVGFLIKELLEYLWRRARIRSVLAADLIQVVDAHLADIAILEPYLATLRECFSSPPSGDLTVRMQWNSPATLRSLLIDNSSCLTRSDFIRALRFYDLCERNVEIRKVYNDAVGAIMKIPSVERQKQGESSQDRRSKSAVVDRLEPLLRLISACGDDLLGNYREVVFRGSELLVRLDRDAEGKYRGYTEQYCRGMSPNSAVQRTAGFPGSR